MRLTTSNTVTFQKYPNCLSACVSVVRLDGKIIGDINKVGDQFQYVPKGQDKPGGIKGELFDVYSECENSVR